MPQLGMSSSTRKNPFSLAFSIEAVIPLEMEVSSFRISRFDKENNEKALITEYNLLEKKGMKLSIS